MMKKMKQNKGAALSSFSLTNAIGSALFLFAKKSMGRIQWMKHVKLIVSAILLLVVTLGFSSWFAFISWEKAHVGACLDAIAPVGADLKNKIETKLSYSNYIEGYENVEWVVEQRKVEGLIKHSQQLLNTNLLLLLPDNRAHFPSTIYAVDANYNILHGSPLFSENIGIVKELDLSPDNRVELDDEIQFFSTTSFYYLLIPVHNMQHQIETYIVIQTESEFVKTISEPAKSIITWAIVILSAIACLIIFILIPLQMKNQLTLTAVLRRRISITFFLVICSTQLLFFLVIISQLYLNTEKMQETKGNIVLALVVDKFEKLSSKNIDPIFQQQMNMYLQITEEKNPELDSVSFIHLNPFTTSDLAEPSKQKTLLEDRNNHINASAKRLLHSSDIIYMVHGQSDQTHGLLLGKMNRAFHLDKVTDFSLNLLTVTVITILLLVELIILIFKILDTTETVLSSKQKKIHYSYMRPAAFLFLFGLDMSMSFIPLHAENLFSPAWGLSKDTLMGLPITVEFLFVGVSIFISGFWNDRRGWHEPFLAGLFLSATGGVYSWMAPNIMHFIFSRALVGTGYGFMLLAAQGFVIEYTDENNRAQGLAQFMAGLYAGSISGGATGALLAEHFGYRLVFLFGAAILYGVMIYTLVFLRHAMVKPRHQSYSSHSSAVQTPKWRPFFKNKIVLALIFFSSLPASIAVVGFLNYFSPIYLNSIGASQATIGRVLMIYGVSLVYLGPIISRHVDASSDKKRYIFIGCLLGSDTFFVFQVFSGLVAAIIGVFILGLSSSFVIASQGAYLLNLEVTQRLGAGKAIGVFRASSRIGQALGPLVFGFLTFSTNLEKDTVQLGLFYLLTAFLFLLLTCREKITLQRSCA